MAYRRFGLLPGDAGQVEVWRVCADSLVDFAECPVAHLCDCIRTDAGPLRLFVSAWPDARLASEVMATLEQAVGPVLAHPDPGMSLQLSLCDLSHVDDEDVPF